MPGGVVSTPQLMLLKKNQWNINIIYYKSDLDNKRKAQVQHTTSLCFLDSKSHPACFPFCSISETQDFLRHVNAGALYGPLKPSAAGFCTEKETCMFFLAPAKIWVIQKSTLNIYFSADPWSKIKCSRRIIHSVETRGRSCQTFHKCVEGRMCAAEAIFENNLSWKLSKSQLIFLSLLILVLLRQQKIWRFPKLWRSQKRSTKKTNDPVHCTPVPSYFKAFKAASQSPPQTTKVPEKGEHWCRIEMDGHV